MPKPYKLCQLGPLTVQVDDTVTHQVAELGSFPPAVDEPPADVCVRAEERLPDIQASHHVGKQSLSFSRSALSVRFVASCQYSVTNLFGEQPVHLSLAINPQRRRFKWRRFLLNKSGQAPSHGVFLPSEIPSYSIFWYVIAAALHKKDAAFIHAAALECNGAATVLAGSGGCGKTSTLLIALERGLSRYLAEDFAVVDATGNAHYVPKTITLYHSDLQQAETPSLNRFHKRYAALSLLTGRRNPKLKVLPTSLFGPERLGTRAPIGAACFLNRTNAKALSLQALSVDEFCWRAARASLRELKSLTEILLMIKANAPLDYPYPSVDDLEQRLLDIYHSAFKAVVPRMLIVPQTEHPKTLTDFLVSHGMLNK